MHKRIHQVMTMEDSLCYLQYDNQLLVGFLMGYYKEFDDVKAFYIEEILIFANCHNKGYGTELMKKIQNETAANGAGHIELICENDPHHIHFYEKLGYCETEHLTITQLGIFCLVGSIATLIAAYGLVLLTGRICRIQSKVFKTCMYYITMVMFFLDPVYLSVLYSFFGGGDMNGIKLLIPEPYARMGFGMLLILNTVLFWKRILPTYTRAFKNADV